MTRCDIVHDRVSTFLSRRGEEVELFVAEVRAGAYGCDECDDWFSDADTVTVSVYVSSATRAYRMIATHDHHHRQSNVVTLSASMWAQIATRTRTAPRQLAS